MDKKSLKSREEVRINPGVVELRAEEGKDDSRKIVGTAAVIGMWSQRLYGWFTEIVEPGAFDDADMSDVVAQKNHNHNLVLARTLNKSLTLRLDEKGLHYEFDSPDTTTGNDLLWEVQQRLIQHSSFMFKVDKDEWEIDSEGNEKRHILKIEKVYDVSPVVNPAYLSTNADARNMEVARAFQQEFIERVKKENPAIARRHLELSLQIARHRYM